MTPQIAVRVLAVINGMLAVLCLGLNLSKGLPKTGDLSLFNLAFAVGGYLYIAYGLWSRVPMVRKIAIFISFLTFFGSAALFLILLSARKITAETSPLWGATCVVALLALVQYWTLTRPAVRALFTPPPPAPAG